MKIVLLSLCIVLLLLTLSEVEGQRKHKKHGGRSKGLMRGPKPLPGRFSRTGRMLPDTLMVARRGDATGLLDKGKKPAGILEKAKRLSTTIKHKAKNILRGNRKNKKGKKSRKTSSPSTDSKPSAELGVGNIFGSYVNKFMKSDESVSSDTDWSTYEEPQWIGDYDYDDVDSVSSDNDSSDSKNDAEEEPWYSWFTETSSSSSSASSDESWLDDYNGWDYDDGERWSESSSDKSKNSKESHQLSKECDKNSKGSSESWEMSSVEDGSSEERITTGWCERWCLTWAAHMQNFRKLASYAGIRFSQQREDMVKDYCKSVVMFAGAMCNSNETTIVSNMTVNATKSTLTTEPPVRGSCASDSSICEDDECCVTQGRSEHFQFTCRKLTQVGRVCSRTSMFSHYLNRLLPNGTYYKTCPCDAGLDCTPVINTRAYRRYRTLLYLQPPKEMMSVCRRPSTRIITPAVKSNVSGTEAPSIPAGGRITLILSNVTDLAGNGTMSPCTTHMDCPFFHCCLNTTAKGQASGGICVSFSDEMDSCTKPGSFTKQPVLNACPCKGFLKCRKSNAAKNGSYGICV